MTRTDEQVSNRAGASDAVVPVDELPAEDAGVEVQPKRSPLARLGAAQRYATVFLLLGLIVLFTILTPNFLTTKNWQDLLITQSVIGCVAFATLFPLIVGEFDLSLGYMIGLVTMVGAYLGGHDHGAVIVIGAMLAVGMIAGLVNGLLTVRFQISSFISTLGVGIMLGGLTLALSDGQVLFSGIPDVVLNIGRDKMLGLAISVWLLILIALVLLYVLEHTPWGRQMYAIGGSERVAFLAGVPTKRLKVLAFVVAGLLVGIGGIFQLGSSGAANPTFGPELLLPGYAAAFLGVTTWKLGYFNVVGTVVAILLLAVGFNGLNLLGVPFWGQPLFNGAVLLLAALAARAEGRAVKVG